MRRVLFVVMWAVMALGAGAVVVLDATDRQAVVAATIMDADGRVLGLTGSNGEVPEVLLQSAPLTIRTMGYEAQTVYGDEDEVLLEPSVYELQDVEVGSADRNVARMVFFVRQYTTLEGDNKQITQVSESMVDFFVPIRKAKKIDRRSKLRVLNQWTASHAQWADGRDSLYVPATEDLSFLNALVTIDSALIHEPARFGIVSQDSVVSDTVWSKHVYPQYIMRRTPAGFFVTIDALAKEDNHRMSPWYFKMLGLTIDINELIATCVMTPNGRESHRPDDITSMGYTLQIDCRGKWFKRAFESENPVLLRSWAEFYLVDRTYLTDKEAREMLKDKDATYKMTIPEEAGQIADVFLPCRE